MANSDYDFLVGLNGVKVFQLIQDEHLKMTWDTWSEHEKQFTKEIACDSSRFWNEDRSFKWKLENNLPMVLDFFKCN